MRLTLALIPVLALACASPEPPAGEAGDELALGDVSAEDLKADGQWGYALECKAIPDLPRLVSPRITISLYGLTLHLVDPATGYDKVFPIGPGQINGNTNEASFGESRSFYPIIATGGNDFTIKASGMSACKFWWKDPETGETLPVFAGLPFLSWYGSYGIHGPIDNYRAPNGGTLRRGFVSHGCIRMEAADILEVYARIRGLSSVPVHVQREPERLADATRVDVAPWIGSECSSDDDCGFTAGFCKQNPYSDRGFCSARCLRSCADRAGYPTTFCVDDPDDASLGMCVAKMVAQDKDCRPFDHFVAKTMRRHGQTVTATVCVPGSPGWVGDQCLADGDCQYGTHCAAGICTVACTRYCADEPGWADTFCVDGLEGSGDAGDCVRKCTPAAHAPECPADSDCVAEHRHGDTATVRYVCAPRG